MPCSLCHWSRREDTGLWGCPLEWRTSLRRSSSRCQSDRAWYRSRRRISNTFALQAGHTYLVKFWIAPDTTDANAKQEPFTTVLSADQSWAFVPNDHLRLFQYLYSPTADVPQGQFELTPYPALPDRFWLDDVVVQEVTATPYRNAAIVRFDQPLPVDARSLLVYNDTEAAVSFSPGTGAYVGPEGTAIPATVSVSAYSGQVLIPVAWSKDPVKTK